MTQSLFGKSISCPAKRGRTWSTKGRTANSNESAEAAPAARVNFIFNWTDDTQGNELIEMYRRLLACCVCPFLCCELA